MLINVNGCAEMFLKKNDDPNWVITVGGMELGKPDFSDMLGRFCWDCLGMQLEVVD